MLRRVVISVLALALGVPAVSAQPDYDTLSIMRPEPGTKAPVEKRHVKKRQYRSKHRKVSHENPLPTRRGSSNPVYPAPLPAPQQPQPAPHFTVVAPPRPKLPPPMFVPETGRVLPNLPPAVGSGPGGRETFQDRAARCAHQAGVYGQAAGNRSGYINSCINQ